MKDISVIIPVYNTPLDKLEKCIESVLKLKNICDIGNTFVIYIAVFLMSCFLIWLSEKSPSRNVGKLLAFIAILLPCILAGMRADTIGTDVKVYVEPMYNAAKQSTNFSSYMSQRWYVIWRYMYVDKFEIGFTTLVYLIEKLGGSLGTVLFFIHVLIVAPVYLGLKKMNKPYPVCLGMLPLC